MNVNDMISFRDSAIFVDNDQLPIEISTYINRDHFSFISLFVFNWLVNKEKSSPPLSSSVRVEFSCFSF